MKQCSIFVGFDPREVDAFVVTCESIRNKLKGWVSIEGLSLDDLIKQKLYYRPTERKDGRIFDVLSKREDYDGAMSTEFAISRFLVKEIAQGGLAMFLDADMLARANLEEAFKLCNLGKAIYCVKHNHVPVHETKMRGQVQTQYARKNWSSVFIIDCDHPANERLTVELINNVPGRDLHRFCWLDDDDIGELPVEWNWLVGHSPKIDNPKLVHFTEGVPSMNGHENDAYADEWRASLNRAALSALGFGV